MNIRRLFLALLVCASLPAAAQFRTVERGIEVALSNLQVPANTSGSLIFKECSNCESTFIPMTNNTLFIVNGKSVGLKKFRKDVFRIRDRERVTVIVMHHLESNTVTAVSVTL